MQVKAPQQQFPVATQPAPQPPKTHTAQAAPEAHAEDALQLAPSLLGSASALGLSAAGGILIGGANFSPYNIQLAAIGAASAAIGTGTSMLLGDMSNTQTTVAASALSGAVISGLTFKTLPAAAAGAVLGTAAGMLGSNFVKMAGLGQ